MVMLWDGYDGDDDGDGNCNCDCVYRSEARNFTLFGQPSSFLSVFHYAKSALNLKVPRFSFNRIRFLPQSVITNNLMTVYLFKIQVTMDVSLTNAQCSN